ncbi:DUF362 domain-containing protein [archaeon]|nr:MAG: DUF362 domain-containing protein [archaeon]
MAAHGNEISGGARTFGSVPVGIEDSAPAENQRFSNMAKVCIAKGGSRKENIKTAVSLMEKDVEKSIRKRGKETLFIKVNSLDSSVPKACTHPEALEAALEYFYGRFGRIIVGDNSSCFMGGPNIYAHLKEKFDKMEFSNLKEFKSEELNFEMLGGNVKVRVSTLPKEAYTISLALPKSHDNFVFTGCSKNMLGCVVENRQCVHALKAHERLFLNNMVKGNALATRNLVKTIKAAKPDLAILDGFEGMEGDGPAMGNMVEMGIALASADCVALDRTAAKLCGFENVPYLDLCLKDGIGAQEAEIIKLGFSNIADIAKKFKQHPLAKYQTMTEMKTVFPKVNSSLVKSVMMNPHPHRMAAKILRMMLKKAERKS